MSAKNKTMPRTFQINIRLNETEYNNLSRSSGVLAVPLMSGC